MRTRTTIIASLEKIAHLEVNKCSVPTPYLNNVAHTRDLPSTLTFELLVVAGGFAADQPFSVSQSDNGSWAAKCDRDVSRAGAKS